MPESTVAAPPRRTQRYQLDTGLVRLTTAERTARGKAARTAVPRTSHAVFEPAPDRPDPVALLEEQAATRVPELVPIRWGRMLVSPFTYYRGAALPMASDLATTPVSGLPVQACGDAHLSNFGLARAHARSGDRIAIAAYLGTSDVFDRAIADFASAYAEQNERDYEALADAAKSGRITAEHGL